MLYILAVNGRLPALQGFTCSGEPFKRHHSLGIIKYCTVLVPSPLKMGAAIFSNKAMNKPAVCYLPSTNNTQQHTKRVTASWGGKENAQQTRIRFFKKEEQERELDMN